MPGPSEKTSSQELPYPANTDTVDVHRDLKALAEKLDAFRIVPVGSEMGYAGSTDPNTFWLLEDGRELSRTTYAALFALLGTAFGAGNGSTTFNIPDRRGRVAVAPDNMGTARGAAGRLTGSNTRGAAAGEQKHTISVGEMPSHSHAGIENNVFGFTSNNPAGGPNIGSAWTVSVGFTNPSYASVSTGVTTPAVEDTGGSEGHNNMQPYVVVNSIIRVL